MPEALVLAAISLLASFGVAYWILYPLLKPAGLPLTRATRGRQFAAYAAAFVFAVTSSRAISSNGDFNLILAFLLLTPLAWSCAFAIGWLVGPGAIANNGSSQLNEGEYQNQGGIPQRATVLGSVATLTPIDVLNSVEEDMWALALNELDGEGRRAGLWAKSFANCNGAEGPARAEYLKQRVRQLKANLVVRDSNKSTEDDRPGLPKGVQLRVQTDMVDAFNERRTATWTSNQCISTLSERGCKVTVGAREGTLEVWEVLQPSGVTTFARSVEVLRSLTARYLDNQQPETPNI
jgi:hypothetical protein